ncbi:MAG TPA: phosphopentomutase [Vicinamibacterales bacterium]|nr:phosphopentomutase [Vicinamibacterales bacterium]
MFRRAVVIVLDSVGAGELPDAALYGDEGSHTLGHIDEQVGLQVPALASLGLGCAVPLRHVPCPAAPAGAYGLMAERSAGKDSVTGHWELMGLVLDRAFPTFPHGFPEDLIEAFERRIGRPVLGNVVASGTVILEELGPAHLRSGSPIVYTSADSVFQIAAHEQVVPLETLYAWCRAAYELVVQGLGVGRVIARPFVGSPGAFTRTANRHDFAMPPAGDTLLDRLVAAGHTVTAIGKIHDLFAGRGITTSHQTASDDHGMDVLAHCLAGQADGLLLANLVDFDSKYGHRNDVAGYARNLERFDRRLAELLPALRPDDLLMVTADHGNDPATPSTDHSREYVPVLATGPRVRGGAALGTRPTFSDLGQTLAEVFGVAPLPSGTSFLKEIR